MLSDNMELIRLRDEDTPLFKKYLQEAFQQSYESVYGRCKELVLPENDMDECLEREDSHAFEVINQSNEILGGAVVTIDEKTNHNHLDFLFVKVGRQSKGVGKLIWTEIERRHPATKVWETCTPYFEKRNIHFYINRCGFHAVELMAEKHPEERSPDGKAHPERGDDLMFRFEKVMSPPVSFLRLSGSMAGGIFGRYSARTYLSSIWSVIPSFSPYSPSQ